MVNGHAFHQPHEMIVPWCKIIMGLQIESNNVEVSYVESVREKFLDNDDDDIGFIASHTPYEYVFSDYFRGYSQEVTYNLTLKAGKYFLRLKSEQMKL